MEDLVVNVTSVDSEDSVVNGAWVDAGPFESVLHGFALLNKA
jgi:hypothetical protein